MEMGGVQYQYGEVSDLSRGVRKRLTGLYGASLSSFSVSTCVRVCVSHHQDDHQAYNTLHTHL